MAFYSHLGVLYTEYTVLNISAVITEFWLKTKCFLSIIPYMALVKPKPKCVGKLMQTTKDIIIAAQTGRHTLPYTD